MTEEIENAREMLSDFCVSNCKARCCNTGSVVVTSVEDMKTMGVTAKEGKSYAQIDINKGCPKLIGNLCSVYDKRPKICREFPIFERGNKIIIAEWCDGYKAGILDDFIKDMESKGLKIVIQ